jgi:RNA polymerase sigma-70 factor (ECF subfamily)
MNGPNTGTDSRRRLEAALGALRPDLVRFAFWLGRDRQLAEDVVQEALLRAWKSLDSLGDPGRLRPWLLTIVRREYLRTFERSRPTLVDLDELVRAEAAVLAADNDAELADMREAIFRLEADYREPLVMQVMQGLSTLEIAAELGLTQGAVLTRLFRARRQLARAMGAAGAEDEP